MTSIVGSLSATRIISLTAYAFALASCAIAWIRALRVSQRRRLAAVLTLLELAIILDLVFNGRWLLHNLLATSAMARNLYGERFGPQHLALDLLGSAAATGIGLALWLFRGRPGAILAASGGVLTWCFWWVEVVSLHTVDTFLYNPVHGVMPVKLAWATCSLMTGAGMLWDTFALPGHVVRAGKCPAEAPSASLAHS
jgi:hypothetical protein